jgi:SWI/SNF-related matrix-associated actin-dependent regulator 1 of chromatin subfamily A
VKIVARMTDGQRATYERAVECARAERRREKNPSPSSSDADGGAGSSSQKVKALFTHLRKIANHPLLVRDRYGDAELAFLADVCHRRGVFGHEAGLEKVRKHLEGMSDFDLHELCEDERVHGALDSKRLPTEALEDAGKTRELLRLLDEIKARGSRPLVFSQWKIVLDVLERVLRANGHAFVRLDGATAVEERQRICDAFNDDASESFAFLLSTRAGGQGLNLTGADAVVIHDCDFNPQIDRQAEDRCHRLGQKKPVTVYRLVAEATVDERIVEVAEEKLHLDKRVLQRRSDGVDEKEHHSERALGDAGDDALGVDDSFGGGSGDGDGDVAAREARAMHSIIEDLLGGGR